MDRVPFPSRVMTMNRTKLEDVVDLGLLAKMVDRGFIAKKESGDGRTLYNYTPQAQYSRTWNEATMQCRGLVVDADNGVLARPFRKFFNMAEHEAEDTDLPGVPKLPFKVYDKLDGSLIIAYTWQGKITFNTRGSFDSDQARAATKWYYHAFATPQGIRIPEDETWLFEWIAPENRIVVDYKGRTDLVLLTIIDNGTGLDKSLPNWKWWGGNTVKRFDSSVMRNLDEVVAAERPNTEGYVIQFNNGLRMKVKGAEYVRLHKILTNVSSKTIWEELAAGRDLKELLEKVPDEFYDWVKRVENELLDAYAEIEFATLNEFDKIAPSPNAIRSNRDVKKEFAMKAQQSQHRGLLYSLYDNKDLGPAIWKMIKPVTTKPFREDIDA